MLRLLSKPKGGAKTNNVLITTELIANVKDDLEAALLQVSRGHRMHTLAGGVETVQ